MESMTTVDVWRSRAGQIEATTDRVVVEAPMEIQLGGVPLAVLMRTPGGEDDLIVGFAITEGIVLGPQEIVGVRSTGEGDRYELVLRDGVTIDAEQFRRNTYTTSSCGVCGKASIDAIRVAAPRLPVGPTLTAELILSLPTRLATAQPTFAATGGLHAAAIL
ncbi:MAG: formate dehydrogenase accessory sulfurtransferase FdhD, partial [Acidimicrobiia bacterium]